MQLTDAQQDVFIEYLKKWKTAECAVCREGHWTVADRVFELREYGMLAGGLDSYSRAQLFPVIPVTCSQCGYVLFVSAVASGVIKGLTE